MSKHTHCRWQLDKGSWISNDVKDENRCVWVLESDYLNMKESLEAENARLKAEVEGLTKAGDAMADELIQEYGREVCLKFGWFNGWIAAKGVQS